MKVESKSNPYIKFLPTIIYFVFGSPFWKEQQDHRLSRISNFSKVNAVSILVMFEAFAWWWYIGRNKSNLRVKPFLYLFCGSVCSEKSLLDVSNSKLCSSSWEKNSQYLFYNNQSNIVLRRPATKQLRLVWVGYTWCYGVSLFAACSARCFRVDFQRQNKITCKPIKRQNPCISTEYVLFSHRSIL